MSIESQKQHAKEYQRLWRQSEAGKAWIKTYKQTSEYKAQKEKNKLYMKIYRSTSEFKEKRKPSDLKYRQTEHSKQYQHNYHTSSRGKEIKTRDHMKVRHNITIAQYNTMLVSQSNKCIGCKRLIQEFTKKFAVDHCHATGKIRGLLCIHCNLILGHAKDSETTLLNLIEHLRKSRGAV